MDIIKEYATPIGTYKIENCQSLNKGLTDFIYSIKKEDNLQRSMVGGYHTKEDLFTRDNPFIKEFHQIISTKIKEYYSSITGNSMGFHTRMASWGMIYGAGNHSKIHTHPGADIYSAYYCKVPDELLEDGALTYIDPRPSARWDRNFTKKSSRWIAAREGTGIIFPAWLEHYVTPHYSKNNRICISTNVFIDHGIFFK